MIGFLALLVSGSVAATAAGPASACSCASPASPAAAVSGASGVFIARATEKVSDGFTDIYEFSVTGVFKGDVGATTTVGTLANGNGCGTGYLIGREYLMFVSRPDEVHQAAWEGYSCGPASDGTFDVRAVTEQVYGPPRPPADSAPSRTITWWTRTTLAVPTTAVVLGVVLLLGAVWMAIVIVRRSRI